MEVKPSKGIPQYHVSQSRSDILPKLPARVIVASPSGGGKTVLITQLLLDPNFYRGKFEKIYYFSASATVDSNLLPLKAYCEEHLEQGEDDPCLYDSWDQDVLTGIMDKQKSVTEFLKHKKRTMMSIAIICDDFADNPKVVRKGILDTLFVRGRHFNITTIVASQKYRLLSPVIRVNATALFVFKLRNRSDLQAVIEENSALLDTKTLMRMYQAATTEPFSFLYIDLTAHEVDTMFYRSFLSRLQVRSSQNSL